MLKKITICTFCATRSTAPIIQRPRPRGPPHSLYPHVTHPTRTCDRSARVQGYIRVEGSFLQSPRRLGVFLLPQHSEYKL